MKIIDISVRNGTGVVVGMILVMMFGFVALDRIPIQLNPTVERPIISIRTNYPGAAPGEVETEVTQRQEQKLAAVESLRKIRSYSREGSANITLEFDWGVNKDVAIIDIVKRLESVRNLPDDVEESQIRALNSEEDRPVVRVTIQSDLPVTVVRDLLEDRVGPQLERVPGVGDVRWYGGSRREIQVQLDLVALDSRRVSISEVLEAVSRENQNTRGGKIEEGNSRVLVRTVGQYGSIDQIRRTVVKNTDEGIIRIEDIARVLDTFHEQEAYGRTMGKPAINMSISKKSGTNTLQVAEAVKAELDRINLELAPMGVQFWVNYDASDYIWDSIFGVRNNLMWGALFAVVVLFAFIRSAAATFTIALTIPLCLIGTFVLLAAFGRSINVISLAGLAFAAGMVVDNAVVVMENIFRHRSDYGVEAFKASRDASHEVWPAILASTLTTLAVFIPILFVREEAGQLFRDIAYSISFAVGLSMIAAVTVVPMLACRILRRVPAAAGAPNDPEKSAENPDPPRPKSKRTLDPTRLLGRAVRAAFLSLIGFGVRQKIARLAIVAVILGLFTASLALVPPAEYLPRSQSAMVFGNLNSPSGISLDGADRQLRKIEQYVLSLPDVYRTFFVCRRERSFFGIFFEKEKATAERADKLIADLEAYADEVLPSDVRFSVNRGSDFRWRSGGKGIGIDLSGPDLAVLSELSDELEERLTMMPEVKNVSSSFNRANPELHVVPDRERIADLGMTSRDIAIVVETLLEGTRASLYREGGKEYDLVVKARKGQIINPDKLRAVTINTLTGEDVRLDELASVEKRLGPVAIEHLEQERVIGLNVNFEENVPLQTFIRRVEEDVIAPFTAIMPPAYRIDLSGSADDLERTMEALGSSFIFALIIIYLLMAALFESFFYPLIIMFSVPLAMTGGFLGIWVTGSEFNVITMLGFVLLAGIVVNNGILLIDFALRRVREGMEIHQGVLEAVRVRMRPIFMTSATTVSGMLPLALGRSQGTELYSGLGSAVVGGMILSTVFTLILIPLLLATFLELRAWIMLRLGRNPLADVARHRRLAELDR